MKGKPSEETLRGKKLVVVHQHQPVRRKLLSNIFISKNQCVFQKVMKKLFAESSRSGIILCVTMGHDDASAIFIFAFCESWKSRRSSLFSRDANKESLLWKLNGAQKLIEPEDTILSKSTKDILKIFLVLRLSVNYADRALKFLEIVSFRFGIIFQNLFAQRNRTCLAFHHNKIGKNR